LGVGLAEILLRVILVMMPAYTLPSEADVRLNLPVLLFTLARRSCPHHLRVRAGVAATRPNLIETLRRPAARRWAGSPPRATRVRRGRVRAGPELSRGADSRSTASSS
jgi:hypothetical protein